MDRTDIVSIIAALIGLIVIYLFVRNRDSRSGSMGRNLVVLAAIALTMAVLFGLGDVIR